MWCPLVCLTISVFNWSFISILSLVGL